MIKVFVYSFLLILGMVLSQVVNLSSLSPFLHSLTLTFLAYIMIEVGLGFTIEKRKWKEYSKDYLIAMTAAALPWIFCSVYFWLFFSIDASSAALVGRFAAPTSAGVLFTMLAAAKLSKSWVFKKARILAIFDDIDTILMIVPLQMLRVGFNHKGIFLILIIIALLILSYRYLHRLRIPSGRSWLFLYAILLSTVVDLFGKTTLIHLEIILPAFALGCLLYQSKDTDETISLTSKRKVFNGDDLIKYGFMFLVGCSLPAISHGKMSLSFIAIHVLCLTFLSNLGKIFPALCYKDEASLRERWALSIAMWPRGEVGAGILIISLKYGISETVIELSQLSLALNLALTGLFIYCVIWILKPHLQR